jgi:Protein of unknown function (DUF998)
MIVVRMASNVQASRTMSQPVVVGSAALSLAGLGCALVALAVLHALPTGLSPIRDAVSQYGITPYRLGYRVQTIGYAVAGAALAVGLASLPHPPRLVIALCLLFAVTRAVISWFPMDAPGTAPTQTGRRHGLLAMLTFLSVAIAAARLPRTSDNDQLGSLISTGSGVLAVLMALSLVTMLVSRRSHLAGRYFGAVERAFYLLTSTWILLVAAALIRR